MWGREEIWRNVVACEEKVWMKGDVGGLDVWYLGMDMG